MNNLQIRKGAEGNLANGMGQFQGKPRDTGLSRLRATSPRLMAEWQTGRPVTHNGP